MLSIFPEVSNALQYKKVSNKLMTMVYFKSIRWVILNGSLSNIYERKYIVQNEKPFREATI